PPGRLSHYYRFCVYSPSYERDLHSFPTRRSSDLFQANVHRARKIEEAFDYLIEAVNFLVQNLHGLPRGAVAIVKPVEGQGFFEEIGKHTSELQSPDHLVCRLLLE